MRIQHFLDVASVPLPVSTISLLHEVLNILLAGKAPEEIAPLLAGGSLTALLKVKGNGWDVRPIAVGEVIRRLASKCACNVVKEKASDFFGPFQFGVACPRGSEKIIHNLREVLEQHWSDPDFAVIKIDMLNAFNLVSPTMFNAFSRDLPMDLLVLLTTSKTLASCRFNFFSIRGSAR